MKKIIYSIILSFTLFITSCEEQLIEVPKSIMAPSSFWKTETDAIAGVNAIFSPLANGTNQTDNPSASGVYYKSFHYLVDLTTDDLYSDPRAAIVAKSFDLLSLLPSDDYVRELWQRSYQSINRANDAIKYIPDIKMDQNKKDMLIGEAKFLRALNYFNLVRLFGAIPFRDIPTASIQEAFLPRTPEIEVYRSIIDDLTSPEVASLPKDPTNSILGKGAVNIAAAHTLLAKVYMTMAGEPLNQTDINGQNVWQLALDQVNAISGFSLYPKYEEVFKIANKNQLKENIFEIQFKSGYGDLSAGFGNFFGQQSTPQRLGAANPSVLFNMLAQFLATPMLKAAFEANDDRKNMIRYSYKSYMNGVTYQFPEPGFIWKYVDEGAMKIHMVAEGKSFRDDDMNYRVFRYADVLLMKAEIINELNKAPNSDAYNAINLVRARAGLGPLSGLNYDSFKNALMRERRVELWFEGHRWFDLKRWGKLRGTLEGLSFTEPAQKTTISVNFQYPKHLYFPIPELEIDANKNIGQAGQNPGW